MAATAEALRLTPRKLKDFVDPVTFELGRFEEKKVSGEGRWRIVQVQEPQTYIDGSNLFIVHIGLELSDKTHRLVIVEQRDVDTQTQQQWYPGIVHRETLDSTRHMHTALEKALQRKPVDPSALGEVIRAVSSW